MANNLFFFTIICPIQHAIRNVYLKFMLMFQANFRSEDYIFVLYFAFQLGLFIQYPCLGFYKVGSRWAVLYPIANIVCVRSLPLVNLPYMLESTKDCGPRPSQNKSDNKAKNDLQRRPNYKGFPPPWNDMTCPSQWQFAFISYFQWGNCTTL